MMFRWMYVGEMLRFELPLVIVAKLVLRCANLAKIKPERTVSLEMKATAKCVHVMHDNHFKDDFQWIRSVMSSTATDYRS